VAIRSPEYAQSTYDRVADGYDDLWSRNVTGPNARLTRDLALQRGERVADLACGTGLYTLEMARLVQPGEVVGVDYSEGMLATARERAEEEGLSLTLVHARAEEFIASAPTRSLDAVSLRFALAYLDWREVLPRIGRTLRPGGRVGVLTSLSSSIPQFAELYNRFRKSPEPAWKLFHHMHHMHRSLGDTWRLYRKLKETFGEPRFITVPDDVERVAARLRQGGLVASETWTETIRLWFASGHDAVAWMEDSGYVTHDSLEHVEPVAMRFLERLFAQGLESFREPRGIPLDLVIGGVIARRD
jgi:ubiquinone/menaquinone biosynthesis C-methylase UbiE